MELDLPEDVEANKEAVIALMELFVTAVDESVTFKLSNSESDKNLRARLNYKKKEEANEANDSETKPEKELTPEQIKKQEERKMRKRMNRVMKVKIK